MNDSARISVFLVDDHPALRFGLSALINNSPDMWLVGEATTGQEALAALQPLAPDVAVIDYLLVKIAWANTHLDLSTVSVSQAQDLRSSAI